MPPPLCAATAPSFSRWLAISGITDTALILAGGESARFGKPKALVVIGGKPMVSRVFDAVEPLVGEVVVSVGDSRMAAILGRVLPRARFAIDRRRAVGPVEGIIRGFEIARGARVLVAPCDAPLLRSELYRMLLGVLESHDAAVPRFDVFDPVRAVYRRTAVLRTFTRSTKPVPSPSSLVDRLDTVFVGEDRLRSIDPRLDSFVDVNRQEDLEAVRSRLRST